VQRIFIGDVQGCGDELEELLTRANQTFGAGFELWCVGDLLNRGPKNLLALRCVRELVAAGRGFYVLGNHEINLLRVWLGLRDLAPQDTLAEVIAADPSEGWMDWMCSQRVALSGEVEGSKYAMVHASVHPDWSLEELEAKAERVEERLSSNDRSELRALLDVGAPTSDMGLAEDRDTLGRLTRCRSVDLALGWSSGSPEQSSRPWHAAWSEREHDYGVVYGHWSMQGLHVAPGLRGLDTGCVHHGRGRDGYLTAWLPAARSGDDAGASGSDQFEVPDVRFWRIPARRRYYA
jgi:bis(5'-nucleosyl)-tetraphosphatase (symmetrical)